MCRPCGGPAGGGTSPAHSLGGGGPAENVAVTDTSPFTVREQSPVPEHAPPQPEKVDADAACADSFTTVPSSNDAEQLKPHSIPAGFETTRPDPLPDNATCSRCCEGPTLANVAQTVTSEEIRTVQPPGPLQPPPQPTNRHPASGIGESVTSVRSANCAEQADPQSIPSGEERTVPDPFVAAVSTCSPDALGRNPNAASISRSRSTTMSQPPVPLQAPLQPANVESVSAVASTLTWVPLAMARTQRSRQP